MIVVRTPFRLPLGGGGTDLPSYYQKYNGFLLTAAINKYMYININQPALVNRIRVAYTKVESVELDKIGDIKHEIVREALKKLNIDFPVEISSMADLSAGTGMGSSSAYAVGLLKGLNQILKRYISTKELAEEACKVEIDLIGKPIGKQDQYAAAFGGIIQLEIDKFGQVIVTPLNLDNEIIYELENRLMMFYTKVNRDANNILAEQSKKAKCDESVTINSMHRIKAIGIEIKKVLFLGNIDSFGKLLHEHWTEKKRISDQMSSNNIDEWYEIGMKNGALGGKVMGAGGGGFLLFCVENGKRKQLRQALENEGLKYMDFKFDWDGCKTLVDF